MEYVEGQAPRLGLARLIEPMADSGEQSQAPHAVGGRREAAFPRLRTPEAMTAIICTPRPNDALVLSWTSGSSRRTTRGVSQAPPTGTAKDRNPGHEDSEK